MAKKINSAPIPEPVSSPRQLDMNDLVGMEARLMKVMRTEAGELEARIMEQLTPLTLRATQQHPHGSFSEPKPVIGHQDRDLKDAFKLHPKPAHRKGTAQPDADED